SSVLHERFVRVAVEPPFARLRRSDHGVPALRRVLAGVAVGRAVAAAGRAARLAGPQVDPPRARLYALLALGLFSVVHPRDTGEVRASSGHRLTPGALDGRRRWRSTLRPPPTPRV